MFGQSNEPQEKYDPRKDSKTESVFEITVSKVSITKFPESKRVYQSQKNGKTMTYLSVAEEESGEWKEIVTYTGKTETEEEKEVIYCQRKNELDLGDMAIYINRR